MYLTFAVRISVRDGIIRFFNESKFNFIAHCRSSIWFPILLGAILRRSFQLPYHTSKLLFYCAWACCSRILHVLRSIFHSLYAKFFRNFEIKKSGVGCSGFFYLQLHDAIAKCKCVFNTRLAEPRSIHNC